MVEDRDHQIRGCLLVEALEAVQLVGDVERGEDGDLKRIDRQSSRGDFAHAAVNELRQPDDVLAVAVGADVVGLVVDFDPDGRRAFRRVLDGAHALSLWGYRRMTSTASGSSTAMASSIASTFVRIVSRSESSRST